MPQTSHETVYSIHPDLPADYRAKALKEARESLWLAARYMGAIYTVLSTGELRALQGLSQNLHLEASRLASMVIDLGGVECSQEREQVRARVGALVARTQGGEPAAEALARLLTE